MATYKSRTYLGFFLLIVSSQWLVSFGHQRDESIPKQPWVPWMGIKPHPFPVQKPYPDRKGGANMGGGGGGGGAGECICNCNCNCQNECNNAGGGGTRGWGGGVGMGSSICLPLPPMTCDGQNCFFGSGVNVGTGNNSFDVPHFGTGGGRNPNPDTDQPPQGVNATDATHH